MDIGGSIALVTGGASGLGLAATSALHDAGASVVILDLPGSDGAVVAAGLGPRATFSAGDVTSAADVDAALDAAGALAGGVPQIVVNCAGAAVTAMTTGQDGPFPLEEFTRIVHVNLIGTFNVIRLAADRMSRAGRMDGAPDGERGVIIATSSAAAFGAPAGQAAYAASMSGIVGMTLPVARDLARLAIRVMTIAPGFAGPGRSGPAARDYAALVAHIVENPALNGETIRLDGTARTNPDSAGPAGPVPQ
jgi:NAD(P)-dependent dehydrogenase (short-subunit alcohol dehydrogenase family)